MKKFLYICYFICSFFSSLVGQQQTTWLRSFSSYSVGNSAISTFDENFILVGSYDRRGEAFLIKVDPFGNTIWEKQYGPAMYGNAIVETPNGGFIIVGQQSTSSTTADIFAIQTNFKGDTIWTKTYDFSDLDIGLTISQTLDGGYVIGGTSNRVTDALVFKIDSLGHQQWYRQFNLGGYETCNSIIQTKNGEIFLVGGTGKNVLIIRLQSDGTIVWTKEFGNFEWEKGYCIKETMSGDLIISGYDYLSNSFQVLLLKINKQGETLWYRTYGGDGIDIGYSVEETSNGKFVVVGETRNGTTVDIFLIKTDSIGNPDFTKTIGNFKWQGVDVARSIKVTYEEGFLIAGESGTIGTGTRAILIRTDSLGNYSGATKIRLGKGQHTSNFTVSNYPNPFNVSTMISITIPSRMKIDLSIYDITGKKLLTLFDGFISEGQYNFEFMANMFSSGIYFCILQNSESISKSKMIILK